ncbi:hypothetical protein R1sor_024203 [Riccia sorocarpa]|uniref:Aminotransferase-like plant mobile domain-containing protein n=1 Tax=Riccia sorocarpa TaxID=122646 RepID=A0ABD3GSU0_9MARC
MPPSSLLRRRDEVSSLLRMREEEWHGEVDGGLHGEAGTRKEMTGVTGVAVKSGQGTEEMSKSKDGPGHSEFSDHLSKVLKSKFPAPEIDFQTCGLEAVEGITNAPESSYGKQLLTILERIGLGKPLKRIWQRQDPQICEEFVRNWNHKGRKTTVFGVEVDVHAASFIAATGLDCDNLYCPTLGEATSASKAWKYGKFCGVGWERWCSNSTESPPLHAFELRNGVVKDLLVLLNKTLWLVPKDPLFVSRACVYLLTEALEGNMLGWGMCVYEKFLTVMRDLQVNQPARILSKQTVAGPLMCFLYYYVREQSLIHGCNVTTVWKEDVDLARREVQADSGCAADDTSEGEISEQPPRVAAEPCPSDGSSRKRPHGAVIGAVAVFSDPPKEITATSAGEPQASKTSVPPATLVNPSKRHCRSTSAENDLPSYKSQVSELTAKVRELTELLERRELELTEKLNRRKKEIDDLVLSQQAHEEEMERRKEEIFRLQLAETEVRACYTRLEDLYGQELKNNRNLRETAAKQKKVIYELTLSEAELKHEVSRLQRLYADEQKHARDCLKFQFTAESLEEENIELRGRLKALTSDYRDVKKRESFLDMQLAEMRKRWDKEFPRRKEDIGRQYYDI